MLRHPRLHLYHHLTLFYISFWLQSRVFSLSLFPFSSCGFTYQYPVIYSYGCIVSFCSPFYVALYLLLFYYLPLTVILSCIILSFFWPVLFCSSFLSWDFIFERARPWHLLFGGALLCREKCGRVYAGAWFRNWQ